jgi:hypothetical protein
LRADRRAQAAAQLELLADRHHRITPPIAYADPRRSREDRAPPYSLPYLTV